MTLRNRIGAAALALAATTVLTLSGCNQNTSATRDGQAKEAGAKKEAAEKKGEEAKHAGWWCEEHGVPESICSLCSDEAAAKFKKEGDWCKIHDRAQSQCFKCDPSKYAKYEAMYVAKFGTKPPRPPEEEFTK